MRFSSRLETLSNLTKMVLSDILKPQGVTAMTELRREKFTKKVEIPKIHITGHINISKIIKYLKPYLLKLQNLKPVQNLSDNKIVFLLDPLKVQKWDDIKIEYRDSLREYDIDENNFKKEDFELEYKHYTAEDILKAALPPDKEGSASFTKVGHIVHLNLREHLMPFKKLIGEVLLDKVSGCETVVNKINNIDNTYRNFSMEILCGKGETRTCVKENNCLFEFDFAKVYWNSRLSTEHERIVKMIKPGDVLFDIFAGVGPFSIPVAKKKCIVYANDLNPESYFWLNHNIKKNKIDMKNVQTFNLDGNDFLKTILHKELINHLNKNSNIHIVMNLPALATEFLYNYVEMYNSNQLKEIRNPPIVYVYCFAKGEDYEQITKELIRKSMRIDITDRIEMFRVRTVSSFKEMMRVTFKLDEEILIGKRGCKRQSSNEESLDCKRNVI